MTTSRGILLAALAAAGCHDDTPSADPPTSARITEQPVAVADAGQRDLGGRNAIRGHLALDTRAFAGRALELCPAVETSLAYATPCARSKTRLATRTDENGDFLFEHLPDDKYAVFMLEAPYHTLTFQFPAVSGGAVIQHHANVAIAARAPQASDGQGTRPLRGRFVYHGQPLDHVALEICSAHGWVRSDPTPCWNGPHRDVARTGADGAFVFLHAPVGEVQIGILEQPYFPHVVFARGEDHDLGTRRVTTPGDYENRGDHDDDTPESWPR